MTETNRWYLNIMSPNTKGDKFAWLDPTSIYINSEAFTALLDDFMADLENVECASEYNRKLAGSPHLTVASIAIG